jgi:iron complex transport system substrate-binding protein
MMFLFKKASILTFSILCVFAILAAGCGNGGKASSTDTPASSSAATAAPTTAPVKKGPSKIVVTYFPYADHLFALGKADAVAGVVNLKSLQDFPVYDTFLKSGKVANLGEKIDFEKIMALNPHLIIASDADQKDLEQLNKIAKTVTVKATLNWQETIRGVAAAVEEEAAAETYINQFLSKQKEVAATMEKSGAKGKTALFIMPWKKSFTYWSGSRMAIYYEKLGFKPFEGMKNVGDISLEGISELNPEYIFIGKDYTNTSEVTLDSLNANPIWNSLTAVKNKKMFVVDTEILGPLAMGQVKGLDYMSKLFSAK